MMIAMIKVMIMAMMIVMKQISITMFYGDATGFYDVDDDYKDNDSNDEFDIRKFHGDIAGFDEGDDDYYDHDDDVLTSQRVIN